jgi:hypothetical protein
VAALGLGGCGGGSDSASTTASTTQDTIATDTPQPSQQSAPAKEEGKSRQGKSPTETAQGKGSKQSPNASKKHLKPVKAPPISSAPVPGSKAPAPGVKTVKGGDSSVQEYGTEADGSERREAAIALQGYLSARAEGDWAAACTYLAQRPTEQLEKLAGQSQSGCAGVMAATGKEAQSQPGSAITEVLSFRGEGEIPGNPSYLIFTAPPGKTLFSMPMYLEAGAWKVGLAQASELPV